MKKTASPPAQDAWIALQRSSRALLGQIDQALKAANLPSLEWYDVLWELEKGPDEGLRPTDLEGRTLLRQYQMSRLLKRMAAAGLITVRQFEGDRRGQLISLTAGGRKARAAIWAIYGTLLGQAFDDRFSEQELAQLTVLLRRLG